MDGRATLATARFRLATAATRISAARTNPPRSGPVKDPCCSPPPTGRVAVRGAVMGWVKWPQSASPSALKASNRPPDARDQSQYAKRGGHAAVGQPDRQQEPDGSGNRRVLVLDQ